MRSGVAIADIDFTNSFLPFFTAAANPEKAFASRQRQLRGGLVLKSMYQRDAELLVLRFEGLTYAELSNALSINPASVGVMLSRAQAAFRKEYLFQQPWPLTNPGM